MADLLKQAGYATGRSGSGGWAERARRGLHGIPPRLRRVLRLLRPAPGALLCADLHRNAEKVPLPNRVREEPRSPGAGPAVVRGRYSHDAIAEEALDFLERHQRERFFLYLPFTIPHAELQAPDDAYARM